MPALDTLDTSLGIPNVVLVRLSLTFHDFFACVVGRDVHFNDFPAINEKPHPIEAMSILEKSCATVFAREPKEKTTVRNLEHDGNAIRARHTKAGKRIRTLRRVW